MYIAKGKTVWDYFDRQENLRQGRSVYVCKACKEEIIFISLWSLMYHLCKEK